MYTYACQAGREQSAGCAAVVLCIASSFFVCLLILVLLYVFSCRLIQQTPCMQQCPPCRQSGHSLWTDPAGTGVQHKNSLCAMTSIRLHVSLRTIEIVNCTECFFVVLFVLNPIPFVLQRCSTPAHPKKKIK